MDIKITINPLDRKLTIVYNGKEYKFNDLSTDYWNTIGTEGVDAKDFNVWEDTDEDGNGSYWYANVYDLMLDEDNDWVIDSNTCEIVDAEVIFGSDYLISEINKLVGDEKIDLSRKVSVCDLWNGSGFTKQYACAIAKDTYYIHFKSMCQGYDMGEDMDYPLNELSFDKLKRVLNQVKKEVCA